MATQRLEFYMVDDSANFSSTNARTQTDMLYFERDTGRCKLGTGDRWNSIQYYSPGVDVRLDQEIKSFIETYVNSFADGMNFEPRIDQKGSAFNADFGETKDTVARGKHTHVVKDILNLIVPKGVDYPAIPNGEVLHDNGEFKPIFAEATSTPRSTSPISSGWANDHERSKVHLTQSQLLNLHEPVQVSGPGLQLDGQTISLKVGEGSRDVSLNGHRHPEYANKEHRHDDTILPDRLPAISKEYRGSVPPTGSPSGRCLHDDGNWKYPSSVVMITLDKDTPFWIVPMGCMITTISIGANDVCAADVVVNEAVACRVASGKSQSHEIFYGIQDTNIQVTKGDIVKIVLVSLAVVQIIAVVNR